MRGGPEERRSLMKAIDKFGPEAIPVDLDRYRKYRNAMRGKGRGSPGQGQAAAAGQRIDPREE